MNGEDYFYAALDHLERAQAQHRIESNLVDWRIILWNSGLAAECFLRSIVNEPEDRRTSIHSLKFWVSRIPVALILSNSTLKTGELGSKLERLWKSEERYIENRILEQQIKRRLVEQNTKLKLQTSATEFAAVELLDAVERLSSVIIRVRKIKNADTP